MILDKTLPIVNECLKRNASEKYCNKELAKALFEAHKLQGFCLYNVASLTRVARPLINRKGARHGVESERSIEMLPNDQNCWVPQVMSP